MTPRLLTRKQAAAYLGMSTRKLDYLRSEDRLPRPVDGVGCVRLDRKALDDWLDKQLGHRASSKRKNTPLSATRKS